MGAARLGGEGGAKSGVTAWSLREEGGHRKPIWWDHSETAEMLENDAADAEVDGVNHENRWN